MKLFPFLVTVLAFGSLIGRAQNNVGINDNNSNPEASSMLDVYSTTKGMLIPRVNLTLTTVAAPVTNPVASLLVYNTATTGDVTAGYYYWNGTSQWVRLTSSADAAQQFNLVSKSVNSTLLKSENLVCASGNITITLPIITSMDDGIEITVKNIGTFTDLIIVAPQSGKTIDANTTSSLTRWQGRTFIANGSNWIIKEKEVQTNNRLQVSTMGSFTTISEVVAFLNIHMTKPTVVILGAESYPVAATQIINLPYPVTFEGLSFGETTVAAAAGVSGSPMFVCQTECSFKMIKFTAVANATGNVAIQLSGSGVHNEIKDCIFTGFNKGIVSTTNNDMWIFENDFKNCIAAGIEIAAGMASGGTIKISECDFMQCGKGIQLLSGVAETISIFNSVFYNTALGSDIGIVYNPTTFTSISSIFISNNAWNNQGTFISGFDFTRSDSRDANAFIINNAGMENNNPHCRINVNNNTSTTTVTHASTYYKVNWTTTSAFTCNWTLLNNKITYQPNNTANTYAIITGNVSSTGINQVVTIAIIKNGATGTPYGETNIRITVKNQPFQFSTVIYIPNIVKNDFLELYVTSGTDNGNILSFQDLQWFTNTQ